jgi:hypothetical protein
MIAQNDFRASFMFNGSWQHVDYANGDIAIIPATQIFPRTLVDREVPLIELFLEPAMLARAAFESVDADRIELVPQLQLRDPLIQHMGLGRVFKLQPQQNAGDRNHGCIICSQLLISSCDPAKLFESVDRTFNNVTLTVDFTTKRTSTGFI